MAETKLDPAEKLSRLLDRRRGYGSIDTLADPGGCGRDMVAVRSRPPCEPTIPAGSEAV